MTCDSKINLYTLYYQIYQASLLCLYFQAPNTMNKNYDVHMLYKDTRLDGSANLKGMNISATMIYMTTFNYCVVYSSKSLSG